MKTNPLCQANGCTRIAMRKCTIKPGLDVWLCGNHANDPSALLRSPAQQLAHERKSQGGKKGGAAKSTAKRKAVAANGIKGGRPRATPTPEALRAAAARLAILDPSSQAVGLYLLKLAGFAGLGANREAIASVRLDGETLTTCEYPGCGKGTTDQYCPEHDHLISFTRGHGATEEQINTWLKIADKAQS